MGFRVGRRARTARPNRGVAVTLNVGDVVSVRFRSEVTQVRDGWVRVLNGTEVHWVREEDVEVEG